MNHIYKVVWCKSSQTFVAVPEFAKSQGKKSNKSKGLNSAYRTLNSDLGRLTLGVMTAMGVGSEAIAGNTVTTKVELGDGASSPNGGVAIGVNANTNSTKGVVVGSNSVARSKAVTVGANSQANTKQSIAIGNETVADGYQAIAIGSDSRAKGAGSVAIGGDDATGIAEGSDIWNEFNAKTGHDLYGPGSVSGERYVATKTGHGSVALGIGADAYKDDNTGLSVAIGTNSSAKENFSIALGSGSKSDKVNAVALGAGSITDKMAIYVPQATIQSLDENGNPTGGNLTYGAPRGQQGVFAGGANLDETTGGDQVSIGSIGYERQIKNLAPGEISATSTDAVNGSQLAGISGKMQGRLDSLEDKVGDGRLYFHTNQGNEQKINASGNLVFEADGTTPVLVQKAGNSNSNEGMLHEMGGATGKFAMTGGIDAQATGEESMSMGHSAKARGDYSTALGNSAIVEAEGSTAVGYHAIAKAKYDSAFGEGADSEGDKATSIGAWSESDSSGSVALGFGSLATRDAKPENDTAKASATATDGVYALDTATTADKTAISNTVKGSLGALSVGTEARSVQPQKFNPDTGQLENNGDPIEIPASNRQITHVAAGSADSDAVNVAQLKSVANALKKNKQDQEDTTDDIEKKIKNVYMHVNTGDPNQSTGHKGENLGGIDEIAGATGRNAVTFGYDAIATGVEGVAIGHEAKATGDQSISIGTGNEVTGNHSGAIGDPNNVAGDASYAFGNNNNIANTKTFVLGNEVTSTQDNAVILGDSSTDRAYTSPTEANVNGVTYGGFEGTANGIVSVGANGAERQIINVAPGEISETSTDAINGSQLHSVAKNLHWKIAGNDKTAVPNGVHGGDQVNFIKGENTIVSVDPDGENYNVKYDLDDDTKEAIKAGKKHNTVAKGTNIASVTPNPNPNAVGGTEYIVNADGTTVSAGSDSVSVTTPNGKDPATNITNYEVDLSDATKKKIDKIDNKLEANDIHNITSDDLTFTNNGDLTAGDVNLSIKNHAIKRTALDPDLYDDLTEKSRETVTVGDALTVVGSGADGEGNNKNFHVDLSDTTKKAIEKGTKHNTVTTGKGIVKTEGTNTDGGINYDLKVDDDTIKDLAKEKIDDEFRGTLSSNTLDVGGEGANKLLKNITLEVKDGAISENKLNQALKDKIAEKSRERVIAGEGITVTPTNPDPNADNLSFTVALDQATKTALEEGQKHTKLIDGTNTTAVKTANDTYQVNVNTLNTLDNNSTAPVSSTAVNTAITNTKNELNQNINNNTTAIDTLERQKIRLTADIDETGYQSFGRNDPLEFAIEGKDGGAIKTIGDNAKKIELEVLVDDTTIEINGDNKLQAKTNDFNKNPDGTVAAKSPDSLATAGDIADAISSAVNNSGFMVKATESDGTQSGASDFKIAHGNKLELDAGKNIKIKQTDGKFSFSTVLDPEFTSAKVANTDVNDGDAVVNVDALNNTVNPIKADVADNKTEIAKNSQDITDLGNHNLKFIANTSETGTQANSTDKVFEILGENGLETVADGRKIKVKIDDDTKTKIDNAANQNLSNLNPAGDTYIKDRAKEAINMENGDNTVASSREVNGVKTFKVDVNTLDNLDNNSTAPVNSQAVKSAIDEVKGQSIKLTAENGTETNPQTHENDIAFAIESGEAGTGYSGDNIQTKANGSTVLVGIKDAPTFAGKVTAQGLDAGGQKVTGVDEGTDPTDAVNFAQLTETNENVTNNATEIAKGFNVKGDNDAVDNVKLGQTVDFEGSEFITTETTADTAGATDTNKVKFTINKGDINKDADGNVINGGNGLATASDVAEAIKTSSFNVLAGADGGELDAGSNATENKVKAKDTVNFNAGKNIKIKQTGKDFLFSTKDEVNFDKVTTAKVTGLDDGQDPTDAVNVRQLNATKDELNTNISNNTDAINTLGSNTIRLAGDSGKTEPQELKKPGGLEFKIKGENGLVSEAILNTNEVVVKIEDTLKTKIDSAANQNLSNISETGKKNITKLGTIVEAGANTTVDTETDATTGQKTYTVNVDTSGAVAPGNQKIVTGDTVNTAITQAKDEIKALPITFKADTNAGTGKDNGSDQVLDTKFEILTGEAKDGFSGENLHTKVENGKVTIGMKKSPTFETVTADKVTVRNAPSEGTDAINKDFFEANKSRERVIAGDGITVTPVNPDANADNLNFTVALDQATKDALADGKKHNTVKAGDNVTLAEKEKADGSTEYTINVASADIVENTDGTVTAGNAPNAFTTAADVASAINNSAWKVTSANDGGELTGTTEEKVKAGETVTFKAGKNIKLTQAGKNFTYATKGEVEFDKVTATEGDIGGVAIAGGKVDGVDVSALADNTIRLAGDSGKTETQELKKPGGLEFKIKGKNGLVSEAIPNTNEVVVKIEDALKTKIDSAANQQLSNIDDAGKKNITKLGTIVEAGANTTVDTETDDTTGQKTYTINVDTSGAVAPGDNKIVTGDTVNTAITQAKDEIKAMPITFKADTNAGTGKDNGSDQVLDTKFEILTGEAKDGFSGDNLHTKVENGKVTIGLKDAPTFAGKVSAQGLDAGNQKITGVAKGTDGTDAVNKDQLDEVSTNVTNNATKIAKGFNVKGDNDAVDNVKLGQTVDFEGSEFIKTKTTADTAGETDINKVKFAV
ncbi:MAG: hypothetical protein KGV45_00040, partial [Gammaproteobacteria bacterium]|nr:hypothetical protein [Gammaproteobacteria bacterium]